MCVSMCRLQLQPVHILLDGEIVAAMLRFGWHANRVLDPAKGTGLTPSSSSVVAASGQWYHANGGVLRDFAPGGGGRPEGGADVLAARAWVQKPKPRPRNAAA